MRQCFTALPEEGKDPGIPEGSVLYAFSDYYLHCNMESLFEADYINRLGSLRQCVFSVNIELVQCSHKK